MHRFRSDFAPSESAEDEAHSADWSRDKWGDLKHIEGFLREAVHLFDAVLDRNRIHAAGFSQALCFTAENVLCYGLPHSAKFPSTRNPQP